MAVMEARAKSLFNIHDGEGRIVSMVLFYAILLYFSNVMARTASTALFLGEYDAKTLPYVNIGVAIVAPLVSALYLRFNNRYSLSKVLMGVHVFLFVTLVALRVGLGLTDSPVLVFILPIYFGVNNSLTISSFWNLLGRIFNLRQGKRLFSLLSSGEHMATIVAGFSAPFLVARIGTENLLIIAAVFMGFTMVMLAGISRLNQSTMGVVMAEEPRARSKRDGGLLKDRYVLLLVALFSLFIVGIFFVGNIFYAEAETRFTTEDEMAGFIGVFMGIFGVLSLFIQFFVAGRVLDRFGVRAMLLATPVGIFVFMGLYAVVGTAGDFPVALFWLATSASMYQAILDAVDSASVNIMYQPLPAQKRTQVQTVVMGVVYPLSIGLAGLLLLFFLQGLNFSSVQLSYATLVVVVIWIGVAVALGRAYPRRLQEALRERSFSGLAMPTPDRSNLPIFEEALSSPNGAAALFALEMLEQVAPETVAEHLPALLEHPDAAVRIAAAERGEASGAPALVPALQKVLAAESDPAAQAADLAALAALDPAGSTAVLHRYTAADEAVVQVAALAALLRGPDEEAQEGAMQALAWMARAEDAGQRARAAAILGAAPAAELAPFVSELLEDEDTAVRRAALAAAAAYPESWEEVIPLLGARETRSAAAAALVAAGPETLAVIAAAFAPESAAAVRRELAVICGRLGGAEAEALLLEHLDDPDAATQAAVLAALRRCGWQASAEERPLVDAQFHAAVERATAIVAAQAILDAEADPLPADALAQNLRRETGNLYALVSFLYDPVTMNRAWEVLAAPDAGGDKQAYALEVVDVLLPREYKEPLLPLSQEMKPAARLAALHGVAAAAGGTLQQLVLLEEAQRAGDVWLAAVLLHDLAQGGGNGQVSEALAAAARSGEPLLAETGAWGTAVRAGKQAGAQTTVQKAAALKQVPVFAALPNETLAEMAGLLAEQEVPAGETFIRRGEEGDALYVILEGRARVHDGERTIDESGPGEVVGEMALLDAQPRAASLTAVTAMRLLRLDQEPFYELLRDQPVLARGIVQVLSERIRARAAEASQTGVKDAARPVVPLATTTTGNRTVAIQGALLDLQKVFVLKGVDLFRESDDGVLAEIAALLEEEDLTAGTAVFAKGDEGDSLYVVAAGQVRVHDGETTLAYLGEGDVFGEMALLDAEPRMASVTAVSATRLLRLEQGAFYELLEERPEVARGIVKVLSQRQRERIG